MANFDQKKAKIMNIQTRFISEFMKMLLFYSYTEIKLFGSFKKLTRIFWILVLM